MRGAEKRHRSTRGRFTKGVMARRQGEMASLLSGLSEAASGRGRLFLISGEPGIGKTRLADEIAAAAEAERLELLVGHCSERDEAVAYLPFVEILENFIARIGNHDRLRASIKNEGPELARLVPKLASCLSFRRHSSLAPAQARRHLFNCFCDFIVRSCRQQLALMILEDLHWTDDSTLSLLDHLALRLSGLPLMVIGTYRDARLNITRWLAQTLDGLLRQRLATPVRLKGLERDEVASMLNNLSGAIGARRPGRQNIRRYQRESVFRRGIVPSSRRGKSAVRFVGQVSSCSRG